MSKAEILALIEECRVKAQHYINTDDFEGITKADLITLFFEIRKDKSDVTAMAETEDFSAYQTKYTALKPVIDGYEKRPMIDPADLKTKIEGYKTKIDAHIASDKVEDAKKAEFRTLSADAATEIISIDTGVLDDATIQALNAKYDRLISELNDFEKELAEKAETPLPTTKDELLELIKACRIESKKLLKDNDDKKIKLKRAEKKDLNEIIEDAKDDYLDAESITDVTSDEFKQLAEDYKKNMDFIKELKKTLKTRKGVKGVRKDSDLSDDHKASRGDALNTVLKVLASGACVAVMVAAILLSMKGCQADTNRNDIPDERPGYEQSADDETPELPEETEQAILNCADIDVDNYEELLAHAIEIKNALPEELSHISTEDIMYAIRLANFDSLTDKSWFSDRDEVCAATYYIGQMAPAVGIDALVKRDPNTDIVISDAEMTDIVMSSTDFEIKLEDFEEAKVEGGYDIYRATEVCLKGLYQDNDKAFYFAKVMNELVCREAVNYSVCSESPVSTHYVIAGMYTANQNRILELTASQALGPIYGTGPRIDGTHGALCVEELASFMYIDVNGGTFIGNEKNCIYSFVLDENITSEYDENLSR